jgi:hypothetical protein
VARDDRVLTYTRCLSAFIAPFLVAAFVVLYPDPDRTGDLFAWTIHPTMTAMVLASAYLGGAWFFVRALRERRWTALRNGFAAVAAFATLLGIATVVHWDVFDHHRVGFWLWAFLYFTAPFLVAAALLVNGRRAAPHADTEVRLGPVARAVVALVGLAALVQGLVMFVAPRLMIPVWPWTLTPLTCRVVGCVFCLGSAGLGVLVDARWVSLRLMLEVEVLMVLLMLLAAAREHRQLDPSQPLTWTLLAGFVGVLAGSAYLWQTYERGGGSSTPKPATLAR